MNMVLVCKNCASENPVSSKHCGVCRFPLSSEDARPKSEPAPEIREHKHTPEPVKQPVATPHKSEPHTSCPRCGYELIFDVDCCPICAYNFSEPEEISYFKPEASASVTEPESAPPAEAKPAPPKQPVKPVSEAPKPVNTTPPDSKPTTNPFVKKKSEQDTLKSTIDPFRKKHTKSVQMAALQPIAREGEKSADPIHLITEDQPVPVNRSILDPENNTITGKIQAEFECINGEWFIVDKSDQQTTFIRANGKVKLNKGDVILMGNRKFIFDC